MRIGLSGGAASVDKMVEQAVEAEAAGFSSLWYASAIGGDPLVAMALAGRATSSIELGTSVLQTYTCHPVLQANRAAAVVAAMGRPGFTLGIGPSHAPAIEDAYGLSYAHPGRYTEEYVTVLTSLLETGATDFVGEDLEAHSGDKGTAPEQPVPVLVAALAPRLLRVAGERTAGTILWMANGRAVETHVTPRIRAAAEAAGRPAPRIVAGLPVAVHDDVDEARRTAAEQFAAYGTLPNYRRILDIGGAAGPADAAIVGDEAAVTTAISGLFDAGATDVWAAIFPVGADRRGSRERTRALLEQLVGA
ncbi:MAG: TIGR03564 family F420-dependent LLM class oxidoreductase [Actinomycetota bacterium]|nr:TIGR03564 family F420-dependent LLM class oxidoreductase [Actinomycetota bacterium]